MLNRVLGKLEIPNSVKRALEELIENLRRILGDSFQLYLFGSYARGDWIRGLSDIDVVVVSEEFSGMPWHERVAMVRRAAPDYESFEILCYTPMELERLLRERSFLREIARYWVRIA